jgi:hypothetical protein
VLVYVSGSNDCLGVVVVPPPGSKWNRVEDKMVAAKRLLSEEGLDKRCHPLALRGCPQLR